MYNFILLSKNNNDYVYELWVLVIGVCHGFKLRKNLVSTTKVSELCFIYIIYSNQHLWLVFK